MIHVVGWASLGLCSACLLMRRDGGEASRHHNVPRTKGLKGLQQPHVLRSPPPPPRAPNVPPLCPVGGRAIAFDAPLPAPATARPPSLCSREMTECFPPFVFFNEGAHMLPPVCCGPGTADFRRFWPFLGRRDARFWSNLGRRLGPFWSTQGRQNGQFWSNWGRPGGQCHATTTRMPGRRINASQASYTLQPHLHLLRILQCPPLLAKPQGRSVARGQ